MNRLHLTAAMAALALAIVGLSAQGQDRDKPRPEGGQRELFGPPQRVLEKLELTQDQQKRIAGLIKDFSEKHKGDVDKFREEAGKVREGLGKAGRDDREAAEKLRKKMEELTANMRKLEDELDGQIAGQLNNEQKKKFEDAKKALTAGPGGDRPSGDRPGPGGDRPGKDKERPGGDRPGKDKERPDVGKGPGTRILPKILMMPGMAEALGLSAEQKEKLAKIRKEADEKMMDVLTPEQKKQLEEMRGRFGRPGGGPGGRPGPGGPPGRDKDKDGKDKDKRSREF